MLPAPEFAVLITRPAGKADNLLAGLDEQGIAYSYQPLLTTQQVALETPGSAAFTAGRTDYFCQCVGGDLSGTAS